MRRLLLLPAVALAMLGAPVLALQQPGVASPGSPAVEEVPLPSAQDGAVPAGFSETVPVDASLVGITWKGDAGATFNVQVREPSGRWTPASTLGSDDTGSDTGTPDAHNSARREQATEPLWVRDANAVRVTLVSGHATDIAVSAVSDTVGSDTPPAGATTVDPPASSDAATTTTPSTTTSSTTSTSTTTTSTTAPATAPADSSPSGPAPEAPPGSAGALGVNVIPVDGPARYAFALALLAASIVLAWIALGGASNRRSRRALALLVVATVALSACRPVPPPPPGPDPTCGNTPEYASNLSFAVVHHTVGSNNYAPSESAGIVRGIQAYHMNTRHYCDIAYNFLIDRYGQMFEGRQGGTNRPVIAAHTGGFNTGSTGVAILGDFSNQNIPAAAWRSLVTLLSWKMAVHKLDPAMRVGLTSRGGGSRWPEGTKLLFANRFFGHRDLWATACPGNAFFGQLGPDQRTLVDAVKAKQPVALRFISRAEWQAIPFGG